MHVEKRVKILAYVETGGGRVHSAGNGTSLSTGNLELQLSSSNHDRRMKTATVHMQLCDWGSKHRQA